MTEDEIAGRVLAVLEDFVGRVMKRVPQARGGTRLDPVDDHGVRSPYASFSLKGGDDELYLMFFLRMTPQGLKCDADFGVNKRTFSEMPTATVADLGGTKGLVAILKAAEAFAEAQVNRAVLELQQDATGGR